jgi:hypothetical protein
MADTLWDGLNEFADVFFNGRPTAASAEAGREERGRFFAEMVDNGVSHIKHGGKIYRVVVTEYVKPE